MGERIMKILQIGMGNVAGGLEAFVMNYYRVLVHMDIQFDFVCMYDKIAYEEEIRKLGGRIYYIPNVKKNYQGYIKELKKILKETKYDAVHVNMLSAANIVPLRVAHTMKVQISNLSEEKKNLTKTVTLAAQLDATNISVQPTNKRGKTAKKVKDIVKFKINFSIVKNITAETGERTLYIRITKPDNDVLTKSSSNTFPYENRELVYSIKKYIEYNGEEQAVTVYWDVEEYLYAGTYRVDIFADGTLIGSQSFSLN